MNNQVAAPCCGSCKYFYYDKTTNDNCCHYRKAILMYMTSFPYRLCAANYYIPRNPIPIIDIPGVKELVEKAFIAGLVEGVEAERGHIYAAITVGDAAKEYIKSLEDKDE